MMAGCFNEVTVYSSHHQRERRTAVDPKFKIKTSMTIDKIF
jgi:hypothetical protein